MPRSIGRIAVCGVVAGTAAAGAAETRTLLEQQASLYNNILSIRPRATSSPSPMTAPRATPASSPECRARVTAPFSCATICATCGRPRVRYIAAEGPQPVVLTDDFAPVEALKAIEVHNRKCPQ
jgi:hypothetical protein